MDDDWPAGAGRAAVGALLHNRFYAALGAVIPTLPLPAADRAAASGLAYFARRVLELDAEDFDRLSGVPEPLLAAVRAAHVPQRQDDPDRGALGTLLPTYRLFLEVLATRWTRGDLANVLVILHLIGEYLPLLAWEPVLGHAGDPQRLAAAVGGAASRWGSEPGTEEGRRCDHSPSLRGALRDALRLTAVPQDQHGAQRWKRYLDRDHSRVSGALAQCANHPTEGRREVGRVCRQPCSVWTRVPTAAAADLGDRMALVAVYVDSPVVALRHAAPVGHGFGVPDPEEIGAAWAETWAKLVRPWESGRNPLASAAPEPGPLPGLSAFLSAVAGRDVVPLGVLDEVDRHLAGTLGLAARA